MVTTSYIINGYDTNGGDAKNITGNSQHEVINGSAYNDILNGASGNDVIHGGRGDDKITGGIGNDKLDGGHGADQFIFDNGYGKDIILDFENSTASNTKDKINLSSYTKSGGAKITFSDLTITKQGGDVKIELSSNDEILIRNELFANIEANDFIFG